MASRLLFSRLAGRDVLQKLIAIRPQSLAKRYISTSNKSEDTATISKPVVRKVTIEEAVDKPKRGNWISYGFSYEDYDTDRIFMHVTMFLFVSVAFVGGAFFLAYMPDLRALDWYHREGYLELHRRAKLGLPLVDKNLIDPSTVELPSDEELDDTEIII